jgi:TM2 domain-containing membrane protein YozV
MTCANHPVKEAVASCNRCGKDLCDDCCLEIARQPWCRGCLEDLVAESRLPAGHPTHAAHRDSRLVAALLSIIPGAGHMYLGLIGKGFALMGLLISFVFLVVLYSDSTGMYWITAYLVPTISLLLMSYAIFDTLAIADALRSGRKREADPIMDSIAERVLLNRRAAGYTILIAGAIGVLDFFEKVLGATVRTYLGTEVPVTAIVVPLVLLAVGLRLLVKGRKARKG